MTLYKPDCVSNNRKNLAFETQYTIYIHINMRTYLAVLPDFESDCWDCGTYSEPG